MLLSLAGLPSTLLGQGDCFPPPDSHEAQLFAELSVPLAFSLIEMAPETRPGQFGAGLEVTYVPEIDAETRTPTICRPGKGPENANLLDAIVRPRATVGLPAKIVLEGSWIPPVRVNGVKPNLLGFALERDFQVFSRRALFGLRAHATVGVIHAPITCEEAALNDPTSECYQGTLSNDAYHPNIFGAEGVLAWPFHGGRIRPFVGGGVNVLHPRFQVHFTNQFGATDNRKVEVDLTRGAIFGGASWNPGSRMSLSGEIYGVPGDAVTGRVYLSYGFGSES
jgi:hypothetical protein